MNQKQMHSGKQVSLNRYFAGKNEAINEGDSDSAGDPDYSSSSEGSE